jgi:predicted alpha/beta-fold hydrolase
VDAPRHPPLLVLFHGLEGSSRSHYARALMHAVQRQGWRGAVVHFRGCSNEPNRLPRAYHSGDSAEIDWILCRLRDTQAAPLFAVGVSLGANALLKWLGEQGAAAHGIVEAAAGISAPLDLAAANDALSQGFGLVYARHFLRTLIPAALAKLARHPGLFEAAAVKAARTLRDFDDIVTAPLHGFADAADYYARSSAGQYLPGIAVPTLVLNARNDPFLPAAALPLRAADAVTLEQTAQGGHVGFVSGPFPGTLGWMPQRVMAHFGALRGMP